MPAFANILSYDFGAHGVTPVAHTFVPNNITGDGVAAYVEAGATPLDDVKVSVWKRITPENGRIKMTYKIARPITATQTINGVASPLLLRTAYAELTVTAEASSTVQEREDILALVKNSLDATDQPWVVFTTNSNPY